MDENQQTETSESNATVPEVTGSSVVIPTKSGSHMERHNDTSESVSAGCSRGGSGHDKNECDGSWQVSRADLPSLRHLTLCSEDSDHLVCADEFFDVMKVAVFKSDNKQLTRGEILRWFEKHSADASCHIGKQCYFSLFHILHFIFNTLEKMSFCMTVAKEVEDVIVKKSCAHTEAVNQNGLCFGKASRVLCLPSLEGLTFLSDDKGHWVWGADFLSLVTTGSYKWHGQVQILEDPILSYFKHKVGATRIINGVYQFSLLHILSFVFSNSKLQTFFRKVAKEVEGCVVRQELCMTKGQTNQTRQTEVHALHKPVKCEFYKKKFPSVSTVEAHACQHSEQSGAHYQQFVVANLSLPQVPSSASGSHQQQSLCYRPASTSDLQEQEAKTEGGSKSENEHVRSKEVSVTGVPSLRNLTLVLEDNEHWVSFDEFYALLRADLKSEGKEARHDNIIRWLTRHSADATRLRDDKFFFTLSHILRFVFKDIDRNSFCKKVGKEVEDMMVRKYCARIHGLALSTLLYGKAQGVLCLPSLQGLAVFSDDNGHWVRHADFAKFLKSPQAWGDIKMRSDNIVTHLKRKSGACRFVDGAYHLGLLYVLQFLFAKFESHLFFKRVAKEVAGCALGQIAWISLSHMNPASNAERHSGNTSSSSEVSSPASGVGDSLCQNSEHTESFITNVMPAQVSTESHPSHQHLLFQGQTTVPLKSDLDSEQNCFQQNSPEQNDSASEIEDSKESGNTNFKSKPYKCEICKLEFTTSFFLAGHIQKHTNQNMFSCPLCEKVFDKYYLLSLHLTKHTRPGHSCQQCGKEFRCLSSLKSHKPVHMKERNFKCNICQSRFKDKRSLEKHVQIHTGAKHFLCQDCGKSFRLLCSFKRHARTHTGERPFTCLQCGKAFIDQSALKRHEPVHIVVRNYKCNSCAKAFKHPYQLRVHVRSHTNERPYRCKICSAAFAISGTLTIHMRRHSGERPFMCPVCGRWFADASNLRAHARTHRPKDHSQRHLSGTVVKEYVQSSPLKRFKNRISHESLPDHMTKFSLMQESSESIYHQHEGQTAAANGNLGGQKTQKQDDSSVTLLALDGTVDNDNGIMFSSLSARDNEVAKHTKQRPDQITNLLSIQKSFKAEICHQDSLDGHQTLKSALSGSDNDQDHRLSNEDSFDSTEAGKELNSAKAKNMTGTISSVSPVAQHVYHHLDQFTKLSLMKMLSKRTSLTNDSWQSDNEEVHSGSNSLSTPLQIHEEKRPFKCGVCQCTFKHLKHLKSHQQQVHMKERCFKCNICQSAFKDNRTLRRHIQIHTGEKCFVCPDCGKSFRQVGNFHRHIRIHKGEKPFVCRQCGKAFTDKANFKRHEAVHEATRNHQCNSCAKTFKRQDQLKLHMRSHTKEKPYKCSICSAAFALSGTLTIHIRTHTGEKPFMCPVCGRKFADASNHRAHTRTHNNLNNHLQA